MTPLSKVFERTIEDTASRTSAVSSITAGVLPAPTPRAGWPDEYAAETMPGPPVARIRLTSGAFMSAADTAEEGCSTHEMISGGAPAAMAASRTTLAASTVHLAARG